MLSNYLRLDGVVLARQFPYFFPKLGRTARHYLEAHIDNAEAYVSLTSVYPVWLALSLMGIAAAFGPRSPAARGEAAQGKAARGETARGETDDRRPELRLALVGAAFGCAGPFVAVYLTLRYLHDLFPFFVVAGAIGLEALIALAARRPSSPWVRAALAAVLLLGVYTCAASIGVTLATGRWL
jgi:hypothetical protein